MNISKALALAGRLPEIYKAIVAFLAAVVGQEASIVAALNGVAPAGWVQYVIVFFGALTGVLTFLKGNKPSPAVVAATEAAATTAVVVDQVQQAITDFRNVVPVGTVPTLPQAGDIISIGTSVALPAVTTAIKSVEDILAEYQAAH